MQHLEGMAYFFLPYIDMKNRFLAMMNFSSALTKTFKMEDFPRKVQHFISTVVHVMQGSSSSSSPSSTSLITILYFTHHHPLLLSSPSSTSPSLSCLNKKFTDKVFLPWHHPTDFITAIKAFYQIKIYQSPRLPDHVLGGCKKSTNYLLNSPQTPNQQLQFFYK